MQQEHASDLWAYLSAVLSVIWPTAIPPITTFWQEEPTDSGFFDNKATFFIARTVHSYHEPHCSSWESLRAVLAEYSLYNQYSLNLASKMCV